MLMQDLIDQLHKQSWGSLQPKWEYFELETNQRAIESSFLLIPFSDSHKVICLPQVQFG